MRYQIHLIRKIHEKVIVRMNNLLMILLILTNKKEGAKGTPSFFIQGSCNIYLVRH